MKILLSLLILCTPLTLPAQEPAAPPRLDAIKSQVNQLLQSSNEAEQAWCAYLIGKYQLIAYQSALVARLEQWAQQVAPEPRLLNAVFDALIQLDAEVAAEQLMPHYARFPHQVMILLSKSPERNQKAFLSLLEQPDLQAGWFVACNALARTKAPGFANVLLRELEIVTRVFVTSDLNQGHGFSGGGGCGGSACGFGNYHPPPDFPPLVFYHLTLHASRGVVAFSPGKYPVFYVRREEGSETNANGNLYPCLTKLQRDQYRLDYLAELLNITTEQMNFPLERSFTLVWKAPLPYKLKLAGIRGEVVRSFKLFARRCKDAELLTEAEWIALTPKIKMQIHDMRSDVGSPLPES